MRNPTLLGLLLTVAVPSYSRAAAPYVEDAAAIAAFFASSVTLTSAVVDVHDVEAPPPIAAPATHALRAALLRIGVAVVRPGGEANYELKSFFVKEPDRTMWLSSLWHKSDGRLVAAYDRLLSGATTVPAPEPDSPPAILAPKGSPPGPRRRLWAISGGLVTRVGAMGGAGALHLRCPTWPLEGSLGVRAFKIDSADNYNLGASHIQNDYDASVLQVILKGSGLYRFSDHALTDGWLPKSTLVRAGAGLAAIRVIERVDVGVNGPAPYTENRPASQTLYLRPILDVGLRLALTRRLAVDVGLDWIPDIGTGAAQTATGPAGTVSLLW